MKLAVVERWQAAVNANDLAACLATSAADIEIVGPRGSANGHAVLAEWLARAGFTATTTRWFCGTAGDVVVEQHARWSGQGDAIVGAHFVVRDGAILRYARHPDLATALRAASLTAADEVTSGRILPS